MMPGLAVHTIQAYLVLCPWPRAGKIQVCSACWMLLDVFKLPLQDSAAFSGEGQLVGM